MGYWLMKSEPNEYSIDDLARDGRAPWDGVRNYQARNMMRDRMRVGDHAFFYHSNCEVPGIVGIVKVASAPYPDETQFDPNDKHYDPKSERANPRWYLVDVAYVRKLARTISLSELKSHARELEGLTLLKRGHRLSIMPVSPAQWEFILSLE